MANGPMSKSGPMAAPKTLKGGVAKAPKAKKKASVSVGGVVKPSKTK